MTRLTLIAAAAAAALIAACGGSSGSGGAVGATTAAPNSSSSPIGLSNCMRSHGVTNFPDPTSGPGGEGFSGGITSSVTGGPLVVDGISFSGPVADAAEKACARFLAPKGPPPQPTASQKHRALRFAECMRRHGVPNFPDPAFTAAPAAKAGPPASVNPNAPAFTRAAAACGGGTRRLGG